MALPVRRNTAVAQWDPFRELDDFHTRMNRLMESAFGGFAGLDSWVPPVTVEETESSFVVDAEVPGVERENLTVDVQRNELSISGKIDDSDREGVVHSSTRKTGSFYYRTTLPGNVDADSVSATLKDGVLRVEVPKTEPAQGKRIEITAG
jgi:HSP20 family protein